MPCYVTHSIDWVVWTFPVILSAERYVKSVRCIGNDFRFFTPLRYVQKDRMNVGCVQ